MTLSFYSQENHGPFELFDLGDFELENGDKLRGLTLAYSTLGTLASDKSNAVLFPTWYGGSSKILELAFVGQGRALDPDHYFIILANQIGNGLSSSPSNQAFPFNAASFPKISIADDVRAQQRLITEKFGIESLALVLGGSMGAQQTYEWAIRFPDVVKRAAPIAGTARGTAHNRLLVEVFIEAITSDPAFQEGWYQEGSVHRGLRRLAHLFAAFGYTEQLFNQRGWSELGFTSVEDFIKGALENHFVQQDPNNLILMARKWQNADSSLIAGGDLAKAFARIKAKTFAVAIEEDKFFPLKDIAHEQALIPGSELKLISSIWGHLALLGADPQFNLSIDGILKELLAAR
jgi:homoserine O-acetyltransferase